MKRLLYYVLVAILLCGCGQREMSKNCFDKDIWRYRGGVGIAPTTMSNAEYYQFMEDATKRKVQLLDFLTAAINEMELSNEE